MTAVSTSAARTRAETAFAAEFERVLPGLPGGGAVQAARRAAMAKFGREGLPHRRVEEWKYTDLRNLVREALPAAPKGHAVSNDDLTAALGPLAAIDCWRLTFVDGHFAPELSPLEGANEGGRVTNLAGTVADPRLAAAGRVERGGVQALNQAFASDGALIEVAGRARAGAPGVAAAPPQLAKPLMLVFVATAAAPSAVTTRSFVDLGANVEATLIEAHVQLGGAPVQVNNAVELKIGDGAVVEHVKVVCGAQPGLHLSDRDVLLGTGTIYRGFELTAGAALARNEAGIELRGEGARFQFAGVALGRGADHVDTSLTIRHVAPGCESRELFKAVLDGNARGIFQGKVIVDREAQKTDGKQMAQALMLSQSAEFDSKPELEIYADDVACGHGSTCAEIDEDLIFYCRSRGIPLPQARALLIESFVGEAIDQIEAADVRRAVGDIARDWLGRSTA